MIWEASWKIKETHRKCATPDFLGKGIGRGARKETLCIFKRFTWKICTILGFFSDLLDNVSCGSCSPKFLIIVLYKHRDDTASPSRWSLVKRPDSGAPRHSQCLLMPSIRNNISTAWDIADSENVVFGAFLIVLQKLLRLLVTSTLSTPLTILRK